MQSPWVHGQISGPRAKGSHPSGRRGCRRALIVQRSKGWKGDADRFPHHFPFNPPHLEMIPRGLEKRGAVRGIGGNVASHFPCVVTGGPNDAGIFPFDAGTFFCVAKWSPNDAGTLPNVAGSGPAGAESRLQGAGRRGTRAGRMPGAPLSLRENVRVVRASIKSLESPPAALLPRGLGSIVETGI